MVAMNGSRDRAAATRFLLDGLERWKAGRSRRNPKKKTDASTVEEERQPWSWIEERHVAGQAEQDIVAKALRDVETRILGFGYVYLAAAVIAVKILRIPATPFSRLKPRLKPARIQRTADLKPASSTSSDSSSDS